MADSEIEIPVVTQLMKLKTKQNELMTNFKRKAKHHVKMDVKEVPPVKKLKTLVGDWVTDAKESGLSTTPFLIIESSSILEKYNEMQQTLNKYRNEQNEQHDKHRKKFDEYDSKIQFLLQQNKPTLYRKLLDQRKNLNEKDIALKAYLSKIIHEAPTNEEIDMAINLVQDEDPSKWPNCQFTKDDFINSVKLD